MVEKLAEYLHELWSGWYKRQRDYSHDTNRISVREKQSQTPYKDLSEEDKEKDRKIARETLDLMITPDSSCQPITEEVNTQKETSEDIISPTEQIEKLMVELKSTDHISDWYHTFGELYKHRIHLFMALCRMIAQWRWISEEWYGKYKIIKSKLHYDWSEFEWWFIVQLETPYWQISYHLPNVFRDTCDEIEEQERANERDGHTSDDVLDRLLKL